MTLLMVIVLACALSLIVSRAITWAASKSPFCNMGFAVVVALAAARLLVIGLIRRREAGAAASCDIEQPHIRKSAHIEGHEDAAECPHVGAAINHLALRLLRRHVAGAMVVLTWMIVQLAIIGYVSRMQPATVAFVFVIVLMTSLLPTVFWRH